MFNLLLFYETFLSIHFYLLFVDWCIHTNICYEGTYLLTFLLECNITVELFLNPLLCSFLWKIYGSLPYLAVSYWSNIGPNKTLIGSVNSMSSYAVLNTKLTLEHCCSICFYKKNYFLQVGSSSDIVQMIFEIH